MFDTSGSLGASIDILAVEGGVIKLFDPGHRVDTRRPPVIFHYGGVGAGISTPGLKVPGLGGKMASRLVGKALNGGGSATSMWNEG